MDTAKIAFLVLLSLVASLSSGIGTVQDEACFKEEEESWFCKPKGDCRFSAPLIKESHFKCSNSSEEYICCPPEKYKRSLRKDIANAYCEQQMKRCKPFKWTDSSLLERNLLVPSDDQLPVSGLRPVPPIKFPFMAQIGFGEYKVWACSGSIISDRFILTSASCVHHNELGDAKWVKTGFSKGTRIKRAAGLFPYPAYSPPAMYHNLGLIQVDEGLLFDDFTQPLCLHTMPKVPYGEGIVTGWDDLTPGAEGSILLQMEVTLIHPVRCNSLKRRDGSTPEGIKPGEMMCGGMVADFGDTCQGFAGSPLVIKKPDCCLYTQIGVSSFGRLCDDDLSPGIYTRLYPYLSWIENIVWP